MMKKILLIISLLGMLFLAIGVYAASGPIRLLINGQPLPLDPAPIVINGRTMVPVRAVAGALGADLSWTAYSSTVSLQTKSEVWSSPFDPWQDAAAYEAVAVVNQYLALMQTAVTGSSAIFDHPEIFSHAVRSSPDPWGLLPIWRPMPGRLGSSVCRLNFQVIDGRNLGLDQSGQPIYEIAARIGYYDPGFGEPAYIQWIKVFTVIREINMAAGSGSQLMSVIDREEIIKTVKMKSGEKPAFSLTGGF